MRASRSLGHASIIAISLFAVFLNVIAAAQTNTAAVPIASLEKRLNLSSLNSRGLNPDSLSPSKSVGSSNVSTPTFGALQHAFAEKDLLAGNGPPLRLQRSPSLRLVVLTLSPSEGSVKEQRTPRPLSTKLSPTNVNGKAINKAFDAR
jgi:hypothetical protein